MIWFSPASGLWKECVMNRRITLRMEIDESVKDVMLDAALFEQVLVNIIKNAAESIEADGEIIVRTLAPATVEVIDNGWESAKKQKLNCSVLSSLPNRTVRESDSSLFAKY